MSKELKISIVIPTYNQGRFIEETILSIIRQTYKNYEIIVIDGGSKDQTLDVIRKHLSAIKYWVSEKDSGQSEAINKGFAQASGDIITWLNSDDLYEPDALEKVAREFAAAPEISILHGKTIFFGDKVKTRIIGPDQDLTLPDYLAYMRFPQPSSFLKKEVIQAIPAVNTRLHYVMDFELLAKALLLGFKIKRTDHVLSRYRLHAESKSNNDLAFMAEWSEVVHSIFQSINGGLIFAVKMEELGLVKKQVHDIYICHLGFKPEEAESIFLSHLNIYYHIHYRQHRRAACERVSRYLEINYPENYRLNSYKKYNSRLKFIPKFVFKLIRALKR
jgi:glycosyltransferase involved in cell wall biosynthesis